MDDEGTGFDLGPIKRMLGIHGAIADTLGPRALVCRRCQRRLGCPQEEIARYLRQGWPKCCGATMELVKA